MPDSLIIDLTHPRPWLAALTLLAAACNSSDDTNTDGASTTQDPSTTAEPTTSAGPTEPPAGSTGTTADPTTVDPTTTTDDPTTTTDDPTTGEPTADEIHVLYNLQHPSLPAPTTGDLRHVVLTAEGATVPTTLLSPPPGGFLFDIANLQPFDDDAFLSPQARWAQIHGTDAMQRPLTWLMKIGDGAPGVPALFPPDDPVANLSFAPAEDRVGFVRRDPEGAWNLHVCAFADGDCVDDPVQQNPPLPPTGAAGLPTFAPVGTRIAYSIGDSEDDAFEVVLGDTAVPGVAAPLGSWDMPFTDFDATFSADAATVYLDVDATANNKYEYFAVDVGGDAPGPLVPLSPPLTPDAYGRLAPDHRAFVWFTGDFVTGELDLYQIDGTSVTGPHALGPVIVEERPPWSRDGRFVAFVSDRELPGTGAAYVVDTAGPEPLQPIQVSGPLSPGSEVRSLDFTADSKRLLYLTREPDHGDNLYIVDLDDPGAAVRLNDPLPAMASMPDAHRISRDGKHLLYSVEPSPPEVRDLFHVDLSGPAPAAPVQINAEDHAHIQNGLSPDGLHAFYFNKATPEQRELYHVDLRGPAPAAPVRLSAEGEDVFAVFIVPPAP